MKIEIRAETSWHDCETCGSSEDHSLTVTGDGKEIIRLYHDGHLGGGNWDDVYDPVKTVAAILGALGHTVSIVGSGLD